MSHATNYDLLTFQFRSWFARNSFQINCELIKSNTANALGALLLLLHTFWSTDCTRVRTRRKCCKTFTIQKRNNQNKTKRNENNDWQPELPLNKIVFALFCSNTQWNQRNNKIKIDADTDTKQITNDERIKWIRIWKFCEAHGRPGGAWVCVCVCVFGLLVPPEWVFGSGRKWGKRCMTRKTQQQSSLVAHTRRRRRRRAHKTAVKNF